MVTVSVTMVTVSVTMVTVSVTIVTVNVTTVTVSVTSNSGSDYSNSECCLHRSDVLYFTLERHGFLLTFICYIAPPCYFLVKYITEYIDTIM